jgi:hypothetical protein
VVENLGLRSPATFLRGVLILGQNTRHAQH